MIRLQRWLVSLILLLAVSGPGQAAAVAETLIIEDFACRGNAVTSCDYILGYIYLERGDVVDEEELGNSRLRLASLPSFHSVQIHLEKGSARGRVRVVIEVTEADPYAREWLAGTSYRFDRLSQLLSGRLTHQNLFGTGKLLDMSMFAYVPLDEGTRSEYVARVQYVDPHWLGLKRVFAIAGMAGERFEQERRDSSERQRVESVGLELRMGRRIFDFSYVSLDYHYSPVIEEEHTIKNADGSVERRRDSFDNQVAGISYGWNSEDDPYFPTRGSRASLSWYWVSIADELRANWGLRKTWTTDSGTSWILQLEEAPSTEYHNTIDESFGWEGGFARPIAGSDSGEVRRGRWYVHLGYETGRRNTRGEVQKEYGVKVGVRLETRSFGIADFYIIGSVLDTERGNR
jgi:hypothetical protein